MMKRDIGRRGVWRGSALIIVLWIVVLLSLLLSSLVFDAHIESRIAIYYGNRTRAYRLAESGLEVVRMLMTRRYTMSGDAASEAVEREELGEWYEPARRLKKGLGLRGLRTPLGDGEIVLSLVPEPARRDINRLGATDEDIQENLERILEVGGVPEERWAELIDSFLDWTDADDNPRLDGGETDDYYALLESPRAAKNAPLDTVDELLLVKGFSRPILYGGYLDDKTEQDGQPALTGIADLLTVYGGEKINVNAAGPRVLRTLPGVDELVAGAIVEEREGLAGSDGKREPQPFLDAADVLRRLPMANPEMANHLSTDTGVYRITSVGIYGGARRTIRCVGEFDRGTGRMVFQRWWEED